MKDQAKVNDSVQPLNQAEKIYIAARTIVFPLVILLPFFIYPEDLRTPDQKIQILEGTLILLLVIVSLLKIGNQKLEGLRRFVRWQIVISLLVAIITIAGYIVMRHYTAHVGMLNDIPVFRAGLDTFTVLWVTALYLALPVVRSYKVLFSRHHIDGVKKRELFQ